MPRTAALKPSDAKGVKNIASFFRNAEGVPSEKKRREGESSPVKGGEGAGDSSPGALGALAARGSCDDGDQSAYNVDLPSSTGVRETGESSRAEGAPDTQSTPSVDEGRDTSSTRKNASPFSSSSTPDLGTFDRRELVDLPESTMFHFLTKHWRPATGYKFPVKRLNDKNRSFQHQWLDSYPWLVYSPSLDGCFCKCCMFFVSDEKRGKFITTPATNWTKALTAIKEHSALQYHQNALVKAENFVQATLNPATAIDAKMDKETLQRLEDNRQVLASIVKTVLLCGRQGFALRGHRDDGILQPDNYSNFNALIDFRIDAGDEVLKHHLQTCSPGATYISKTTQNNLINIIGENMRAKIVSDIKSAVHFSVLADEATDSANWEQLSIVVRYVDGSVIREDFLGFVPCEDTTGETLAQKIVESLESWGLDTGNIRGQGFDGAANMSGKNKGVQARIKELNPKALYFHCAAHCLNLCIVKSCQVQNVKNMFSTMKDLALFFNLAPKRQRKLERVIEEAFPESKKTKMVGLCKTRWVERHTAFETFASLYKAVFDCLGQMMEEDGWDGDTISRAGGFVHALQSSSFLVAFVVFRRCLQYLYGITLKLQESAKDIVAAYREISNITSAIQDLRNGVDAAFAGWFQEANEMAQFMNCELEKPRTVGRQTLRDNQPAETAETYFKICIAIPVLDHLLAELSSRFQFAELAADGLGLVPEVLIQNPRGFATLPQGLRDLATLWDTDLPDPPALEAEYNRWLTKWHDHALDLDILVAKTAATALEHCNKDFYPNVHKLLSLLCTLPITTCECERSFSRLRGLKNYLRSTMGEDRLVGLALMLVHRNVPVDVEEVVDTFAARFRTIMKLLPRKMLSAE